MMILRTNRFIDMSCALLPTAGFWWVLRAGYSPWARLAVATWAVLWCLAFKHLLALYISPETWLLTRNLVAGISGISFLGWMAVLLLGMGKSAVAQERSRSFIEESNAFFEDARIQGVIALPTDASVNLRHGEFIVYSQEGPFYEFRTSGRSFSKGRSHRSFWGGGSFTSESQRDMDERLTQTCRARLHITNQRILVLADKTSYAKSLDQVLQMTTRGRTLLIAFEGIKKPVGVELPNPFIPIGFHKWLNAVNLTEASLIKNRDALLLKVKA